MVALSSTKGRRRGSDGGSGGGMLEHLPKPLLLMILGFVEDRPRDFPVGKLPGPNRLLPLRLVSKSFREAVDESVSYLTCELQGHFPVFEPSVKRPILDICRWTPEYLHGLRRWPCLSKFVLSTRLCGIRDAVLEVVLDNCPGLRSLLIRGCAKEYLGGRLALKPLNRLRDLRTLRLHRFVQGGLAYDDIPYLTSITELELYDIQASGILETSTSLRRLTLEISDSNLAYYNADVTLRLGQSTNLERLRVRGYSLHGVQLPKSLTSLSLRNVFVHNPTDITLDLVHLVELDLEAVMFEHMPLHFPLPTSLTSLRLRASEDEELSFAGSADGSLEPLLPALRNLRLLHLEGMPNFTRLPDLRSLSKLTSLEIQHQEKLTCVSSLNSLVSLERLKVKCCLRLPSLSLSGNLRNLAHLSIGHLPALTGAPDLRQLASLTHLQITKLQHFPLLDGLHNLRIISCKLLSKRSELVLPHLQGLQVVELRRKNRPIAVHGLQEGVKLSFSMED